MSTTSKKPPLKHESWQDELKTTDDQYREHDAWKRKEREKEEKRKTRMVDDLSAQKERMLEEKERNERKQKILAESRAKLLEKKVIKEENIQTTKNKWWVKVLNVIMGWEE